MDNKKFQIIDWDGSNFANEIKLDTCVIEEYDDLIKKIKKNQVSCEKEYVIAIGFNPSNITVFNDDETNLYLRNKIQLEYRNNSNVKGYILVNLISKIQNDSKKVGFNDVDEEYIKDIIKLINDLYNYQIVLFFGKMGVELINHKGKSLSDLKKTLIANRERIKYTSKPEKFIHPGHSANNYILTDWKDGLLERND